MNASAATVVWLESTLAFCHWYFTPSTLQRVEGLARWGFHVYGLCKSRILHLQRIPSKVAPGAEVPAKRHVGALSRCAQCSAHAKDLFRLLVPRALFQIITVLQACHYPCSSPVSPLAGRVFGAVILPFLLLTPAYSRLITCQVCCAQLQTTC